MQTIRDDLLSGLVVFFVALPLCLGVALASNAPLYSGILAGIVGGIVVGFLSSSSVSVSGPAAGLTAVVANELVRLGSFEAFLAAIILAGIIQIILSICKLGMLSEFFPSSVVKGLLFAIGLILILKQFPHLFGHDTDPMGNESFIQPDKENTFSALIETYFHIHKGSAIIGLFSLAFLTLCDNAERLKKIKIAAPIIVIILSVAFNYFLSTLGNGWQLSSKHLVQVPVADSLKDAFNFLIFPDFSILKNTTVFMTAFTVAIVASLETLLNLEVLDKIDPLKRSNPPNRELFAQGVGNITGGLIGALPLTSVVVRSSVNINSGAKTKLSCIFHGCLLFISVLFVPELLNTIPLSTLAAILIVTGFKLANPSTLIGLWNQGKYQFAPFIITTLAILLTDLLIGIVIGLAVSLCFILHSNIRRPIRKIMEKHTTGHEVMHIELPNQVSFLNRAGLDQAFKQIPKGGHVLIDARSTDYIDPDILDLISDFQKSSAANKIKVSLSGFSSKFPGLKDQIRYTDFTTKELQSKLSPEEVLTILKEGNTRFLEGVHLTRNLESQLGRASKGQFPLAVVLSCIDSRAPVELLFDLSIGDIFTVRIAGNVISHKVIGSIEYASAVAGAKLVVVMGHTSCGAVKAAFDFAAVHKTAEEATGCGNLDSLITEIQKSINFKKMPDLARMTPQEKELYLNQLSRKNVLHSIEQIKEQSEILRDLVNQHKISIVGAMYNISSGEVEFIELRK